MLDLQVPLLAAKALILLLLFAFVYAVVRRGIGDLRSVPEDEVFVPGGGGSPQGDGRSGGAYDGAATAGAGRPGSATLVVEESEVLAPKTRFRIGSGTMSIGRSNASDIILKSDDFVSGRHAKLTRHAGLLYVEDAGSTNGTYVNGRKAEGVTPLKSGDRVQVGSTTFRFAE